jgi:hypothetical protein
MCITAMHSPSFTAHDKLSHIRLYVWFAGYPAPPAEDAAPQQQQPQQQQPQPQRPQPQQPLSNIGRARAMCKLLGMADQASIGALVTKEAEAAAIKYFNAGAFFK